jgi:hypothetical protein
MKCLDPQIPEDPMLASVRLNRRGATLPLTVIVLALMAVAVAITYGRISSERVISADAKAQFGAFAVAQSGLNRFFANQVVGVKPADGTVMYNDLPGGTSQVDVRMLRDSIIVPGPPANIYPAVYLVTSRGRYTAARRYNSLTPSAERTVGTYALWTPTPFEIDAAFTSLVGVTSNGNSSSLSGIDRCGANSTIAGVGVPNAGDFQSSHWNTINGSPDDAPKYLGGTPGIAGTARDSVDIDWNGIVNQNLIPSDVVYNGLNWPPQIATPGVTDMTEWPVIRVNGDLTMPQSGKGILIVTGNVTWNGTPLKTWEGLVLIGGTITGNGNANIFGALVTGLNLKLGQAVPPYDVGNGTKTYQYDSCALSRALGQLGSLQRVRNAWTDTWSSY